VFFIEAKKMLPYNTDDLLQVVEFIWQEHVLFKNRRLLDSGGHIGRFDCI